MQINLPEGLITDSTVAMVHVSDVEHMEVDTNDSPNHAVTLKIPLVPIPSLSDERKEEAWKREIYRHIWTLTARQNKMKEIVILIRKVQLIYKTFVDQNS